MVVMAYEAAWPAAGQPFTVEDLDRLPDDGRRYELLDGVLIVSPRPTTVHQMSAMRLAARLYAACPEDLCVVPEPAMQISDDTEFDPDIVVVRRDDVGEQGDHHKGDIDGYADRSEGIAEWRQQPERRIEPRTQWRRGKGDFRCVGHARLADPARNREGRRRSSWSPARR